jgi:putative selenium metabolism protein SsnA
MLITNATVVTWQKPNQLLSNYAIHILGDKIHDIGSQSKMMTQYPDEPILDANGQLVMPGNICAHTHFYGAFSRGMNIPGDPPKDFSEILSKIWWPLDKALTHEDVYYSTLVCLIDAIKHGTTTLIDHHSSPNCIDGSLDVIADAVRKSGTRCVLSYEVSDRNGTDNAKAGIAENVRFINSLKQTNTDSSTIKASFGLHASMTLSSNTLNACRNAIPDNVGFHIHAAESTMDEYDSINKYKKRVIDRLFDHNILGPQSIVAHAVHVDNQEVIRLMDTGTWVTHQPRSNMNNGVGVAAVDSLLRIGIKLCLGNDGFSNSMWEEWKTAYLLQKVANLDPRPLSASEVAKIAIYNNAALANVFFRDSLFGEIAPGAYADLIFVDYLSPTPLHEGNLPWHIIFGFRDSMITTTIVGGKILMKDRELTSLDEKGISTRSRELSIKAWQRYETNCN